jgi:Asp/Glu/hydantoin racemase
MRIWHQSMAPFAAVGAYAETLARHVETAVSPGVEVELHGLETELYGGHPPARVLRYPYAAHLVARTAIERCVQAEAEGYDAVAFATFAEPFLRESRAAVDIPVASMLESALLVGCSVARRMAFVSLEPNGARRVRDVVERHGFATRVSGFHTLGADMDEQRLSQAFTDPTDVL